jgi:hypothetical protein
MTDARLLNAIACADALDNAPTPKECVSVRQVCEFVLADPSLQPMMGPPSAADETLVFLLSSTAQWADELRYPDLPAEGEWWERNRVYRLDKWRHARIAAEMLAYGHTNASTLLALDRAEHLTESAAETVAETSTETVALDDTAPPPAPVTFQQAFEAGQTGVPSQEAGHSVLFPGVGF